MGKSLERVGLPMVTLSTSTSITSTGAGSWYDVQAGFSIWALQVDYSTGSTAITVQLQGALTTGFSTAATVIKMMTQANAAGAVLQSTGRQVFTKVRYVVTALSTSTGAGADSAISGIHITAVP